MDSLGTTGHRRRGRLHLDEPGRGERVPDRRGHRRGHRRDDHHRHRDGERHVESTSIPVTVVDPARIRLYAIADTYVESSTADTNYGTQYGMLTKPPVNGSADRIALMRFDLSPVLGKEVTSAVLTNENVVSGGSTDPVTVRVDAHEVTGDWDEKAVTYSSKPDLGATVGSFLSTRTTATASADLTDFVGPAPAATSARCRSASPRTTPARPPGW